MNTKPIEPGEQHTEVAYADLQLGDRVRLSGGGAYNDATVTQVTATDVTFFRPYVVTADFSFTGGVTPYIGTERFSVRRAARTVLLLYRVKPGDIR